MLLSMIDNIEPVSGGLGCYYLMLAAMNAVAALYLWRRKDDTRQALVWLAVAVG